MNSFPKSLEPLDFEKHTHGIYNRKEYKIWNLIWALTVILQTSLIFSFYSPSMLPPCNLLKFDEKITGGTISKFGKLCENSLTSTSGITNSSWAALGQCEGLWRRRQSSHLVTDNEVPTPVSLLIRKDKSSGVRWGVAKHLVNVTNSERHTEQMLCIPSWWAM